MNIDLGIASPEEWDELSFIETLNAERATEASSAYCRQLSDGQRVTTLIDVETIERVVLGTS